MLKNLFSIIFLFLFSALVAQVGIGTDNPHSSSILDISSASQGVLLPRLTSLQRDAIINPAEGLLIYNLTTSDFNYFNTNWKPFSKDYKSVNGSTPISTTSTNNIGVTDMEIFPSQGMQIISYESEVSNTDQPAPIFVSATDLLTDFTTLYSQLNTYNIGIANTHAAAYGSGEIIFPGKYNVGSAATVAGSITLDGQGDSDAIFIFKSTGALDFAAASSMVLINGAAAENIFWISDAAVGVGANSTIYGNLISNGAAIAVGAATNIEGRLLTASGAIAFGTGVCSVPIDESAAIDLGNLKSFALFTGNGAITNAGASTYNGNVCSGAGDTSSLNAATVNGIIVPPNQSVNIASTIIKPLAVTFGLYLNNTMITSTRKKVHCRVGHTSVSLAGVVNIVNQGDAITVKWQLEDLGKLYSGNRVLTSIKVE
jgi:hypothetical protein